MSILQHARPLVKTPTRVLFDSANPPRSLAFGLGVLSPADMRRIDAVRADALATARETMPEHDALEYAAWEAERALATIRLEQVARHRPERAERRMPYTAADLQEWAETSPLNAIGYAETMRAADPAWDVMAGEAECVSRMGAGVAVL